MYMFAGTIRLASSKHMTESDWKACCMEGNYGVDKEGTYTKCHCFNQERCSQAIM